VSKMKLQQNKLESDYLHTNLCIEYDKILYNLCRLVEFLQILLSPEKIRLMFKKLNTKISLPHVLNNEFMIRLYRMFCENKLYPFGMDELRRLTCVRERFVFENENEENQW
ncbi:hypothetical protein THOM_3276, partial [Trachipleistophora hominis]